MKVCVFDNTCVREERGGRRVLPRRKSPDSCLRRRMSAGRAPVYLALGHALKKNFATVRRKAETGILKCLPNSEQVMAISPGDLARGLGGSCRASSKAAAGSDTKARSCVRVSLRGSATSVAFRPVYPKADPTPLGQHWSDWKRFSRVAGDGRQWFVSGENLRHRSRRHSCLHRAIHASTL